MVHAQPPEVCVNGGFNRFTIFDRKQGFLVVPGVESVKYRLGLGIDVRGAQLERMSDSALNSPSGKEDVLDVTEGSLSQWQLIRLRFRKHKLAVVSLYVLVVLYSMALFAEFFSPYTQPWKNLSYAYCPPTTPSFSLKHGFFTYALKLKVDPITLRKYYIEDRDEVFPLGFLVKGVPYKLFGLIPAERHFVGVDLSRYQVKEDSESAEPVFLLLGADRYGRDILSRVIYGSRISLSIGLFAILITFILGVSIGGVSGYCSGRIDTVIQRIIEIINSFPQLPLWLAIGAVVPGDWPPLRVYFAITIVLSLLNWTGLARVVRGKILALREEDYALAARLIGANHGRIIFRHLLPGFTSHIIVTLTLSVPGMILGETALSFLGLGLRPPVVSWGVMLQDCLNLQVVANYPWLLMPVIMIIMTVLSFNFLGDGLRDAADPYSSH